MDILNKYYNMDSTNVHLDEIFKYNFNIFVLREVQNNFDYNIINYCKNYNIQLDIPILNIYGNIITEFSGKYYILFATNDIPINESYLLQFINQPLIIFNKDVQKLWSQKIDYYEYQINQFGNKFNILRESFGYIAGMAEIGIQLLNKINLKSCYMCYVHKRIQEDNFYNPMDLILDYRIRDMAEYIKYSFFNNKYININTFIQNVNLTSDEYILLFARLLFITPYFDMFEDIINKKVEENSIKKIIYMLNDYEQYLKQFYLYMKKYMLLDDIELFSY